MAPPAESEKRGVVRMIERGQSRQLLRGQQDLPRSVLRLAERADGARTTSAPGDIEVIAREASGGGAARAVDLRSAVVRKVVEMEVLDASRGIARAQEQVQRAPAPAQDDDKGTASVFEQWYQERIAEGMSEREIEEHLALRVRGLRQGLLQAGAERQVSRRV